MLLLQQWYRISLVILGQRLILIFLCLLSSAEELIVENATFFNVRQQDFPLLFGRTQSVFE